MNEDIGEHSNQLFPSLTTEQMLPIEDIYIRYPNRLRKMELKAILNKRFTSLELRPELGQFRFRS